MCCHRRPPTHPRLADPTLGWTPHRADPPAQPALHYHVTVDGRGCSAFRLTKRTCKSSFWTSKSNHKTIGQCILPINFMFLVFVFSISLVILLLCDVSHTCVRGIGNHWSLVSAFYWCRSVYLFTSPPLSTSRWWWSGVWATTSVDSSCFANHSCFRFHQRSTRPICVCVWERERQREREILYTPRGRFRSIRICHVQNLDRVRPGGGGYN